SSIQVRNCTFYGNSATNYGAVSGGAEITNSIIWKNFSQNTNAISEGNGVSFSDIEGGWTGTGTNNINSDPFFRGYSDYHLSQCSPCIDTGTTDGTSAVDLDGMTRPYGSTV